MVDCGLWIVDCGMWIVMKKIYYIVILVLVLTGCAKSRYFINEGHTFGTYYNIRYEASHDLEKQIVARLHEYDASLSFFNDSSIVSRINHNEEVVTDSLFEAMWTTACEVSELSQGAFDITCAPLISAWGFGKDKGIEYLRQHPIGQRQIDSLMSIIGYRKMSLKEHHVTKQDPRVTINASAIAKGQGCDGIAALLAANGCENYLVDIGGEVVAKGLNPKGEPWKIGISKPIDDPTGTVRELQEIIATTDLSMASSGNYRQFYYDGTERRSHTIDPRTGYPVQHSLLGATVVSSSCMRADALATACMVLGARAALEMIEKDNDSECYLIVHEGEENKVIISSGWNNLIGR